MLDHTFDTQDQLERSLKAMAGILAGTTPAGAMAWNSLKMVVFSMSCQFITPGMLFGGYYLIDGRDSRESLTLPNSLPVCPSPSSPLKTHSSPSSYVMA